MNCVLLMMGGTGSRFGASRPKQYTLIDDVPLFAYILKKLDTVSVINQIVIVSHRDWIEYVEEWANSICKHISCKVTEGGATRSESVKNGLLVMNEFCNADDVVCIHDATHPYVDEEGIQKIIEAVNQFGGATLVSKNYDTVYRISEDGFLQNVEPRDFIVAGASPEAFRFGNIFDIYMNSTDTELSTMTSAGAIALAHNIPMKVIPSNYLNLKITYPNDMKLFLELINTYFFPETEVN